MLRTSSLMRERAIAAQRRTVELCEKECDRQVRLLNRRKRGYNETTYAERMANPAYREAFDALLTARERLAALD